MNTTMERKQELDKTILLAELDRLRLATLDAPYKADIHAWVDRCKADVESTATDRDRIDDIAVEVQQMFQKIRERDEERRQKEREDRPATERLANTLGGDMDR